MAVGDRDFVMKNSDVENVEAGLRREFGHGDHGERKWEVKIYEGCGHGFAVRADPKKVVENEAAGKVADQAVEWFRMFLGGNEY